MGLDDEEFELVVRGLSRRSGDVEQLHEWALNGVGVSSDLFDAACDDAMSAGVLKNLLFSTIRGGSDGDDRVFERGSGDCVDADRDGIGQELGGSDDPGWPVSGAGSGSLSARRARAVELCGAPVAFEADCGDDPGSGRRGDSAFECSCYRFADELRASYGFERLVQVAERAAMARSWVSMLSGRSDNVRVGYVCGLEQLGGMVSASLLTRGLVGGVAPAWRDWAVFPGAIRRKGSGPRLHALLPSDLRCGLCGLLAGRTATGERNLVTWAGEHPFCAR